MKKLFIAEKHSQCKSLMETFEPTSTKKTGYWEGNNYIFTYAIGHLYRLKCNEFAKDINLLPYLFNPAEVANPINYYEANKKTLPQLKVVNKQLIRNDISEIICATDPDAEGEAIYRTIVENVGISKNINQTRLIIKDTTVEGLKKQFKIRKPISNYEGLRQKAYTRALTDYTLGINLSQAFTIKAKAKTPFSVGRVQTPVLKMIVDRYIANVNYVKKIHYQIKFKYNELDIHESELKFKTVDEANAYINSKVGENIVFDINAKDVKSLPPSLYDLADIQKFGVDKLSISPLKTLAVVQSLYEKKLVTYPRTDCKIITNETAEMLDSFYGGITVNSITLTENINKKVIGDVNAHEGLTLTAQKANLQDLSKLELDVYNEIKNRFLANYLKNATAQKIEVESKSESTHFKGGFNAILEKGYLELLNDKPFKNLVSMDELEQIQSDLSKPIQISRKNLLVNEIVSPRPALYTESSILSKMQNIHADIDDVDLKKITKNIEGIGTPATRGTIIENLFKQNYIQKKGKGLIPTDKGIFLINELQKQENPLINAEYTAILEKALIEVEKIKILKNILMD